MNKSYRWNNLTKRTDVFSISVLSFVYLYALFAPYRIKHMFSFIVEGRPITNEIWLIIAFVFILSLNNINRNQQNRSGGATGFLRNIIFAYVAIILIGGFTAISVSQYIYASILFLCPMLLFFPVSKLDHNTVEVLFRLFIVTCLVYAIFAIVLTTNYAYFMILVGNPIRSSYYLQTRASMMLGSSITVSYYFNLTLPLCFFIYYRSEVKKWRIVALFAIIANVAATFVLLSRIAFLCAVGILLFYILFAGSKKYKVRNKIIFGILFIAMMIYIYQYYDLSRLFMGFNFGSGASDASRIAAAMLGVSIFSAYPLFGSGMGRFYERIYEYRFIEFNGTIGLIDPHNMYVLILSELGLSGIIVTIVMFIKLYSHFSHISDRNLRATAYVTLTAFLFDAMGGSHLFNEISFAVIFWIYMGAFNALVIKSPKPKL